MTRSQPMNVHHLELFYYVAKHGGITPAVRRMPYGIQQPAVSGQMLQLEKNLGVRLFQRRPFALTPAGSDLYEFLAPFFSQLDEVAGRLRGEAGQHLRLAASPSVLTMHLPVVLESLKRKMPELRLTLREVMPAEIDSLLASQEVDVAISAQSAKPAPPVKTVELVRLPLLLLVPEGAPSSTFAALKKSARSGEISEPLISLPARESISQLFQEALAKDGLRWGASMEVNTLELVHSYVSHGFGYGVTVEVSMPAIPENVRVIRLTKAPPLVMGVSYTGKLGAVAERFVEEAVDYAQKMK